MEYRLAGDIDHSRGENSSRVVMFSGFDCTIHASPHETMAITTVIVPLSSPIPVIDVVPESARFELPTVELP